MTAVACACHAKCKMYSCYLCLRTSFIMTLFVMRKPVYHTSCQSGITEGPWQDGWNNCLLLESLCITLHVSQYHRGTMARRLESLFIMRKPVSHTVRSVRYYRGTMARRLESFLVSILCRTNVGLKFLDSVTMADEFFHLIRHHVTLFG